MLNDIQKINQLLGISRTENRTEHHYATLCFCSSTMFWILCKFRSLDLRKEYIKTGKRFGEGKKGFVGLDQFLLKGWIRRQGIFNLEKWWLRGLMTEIYRILNFMGIVYGDQLFTVSCQTRTEIHQMKQPKSPKHCLCFKFMCILVESGQTLRKETHWRLLNRKTQLSSGNAGGWSTIKGRGKSALVLLLLFSEYPFMATVRKKMLG